MNDFDDQLKSALRRQEPPPDFVNSIMARLPQKHRAVVLPKHERLTPRHDFSGNGVSSLIIKGVKAAWYYGRPSVPVWTVSRLAGAPKIGAEQINQSGRLTVGDWLETDSASRAKIDVGRIGYVEVEPESRVRLIAARLRDHRLALIRGCLKAVIWAPPRLFFVETPSATAVDLGCAYTLKVTDTGASFLHVTLGWVALVLAGRDAIVPAGALCETRAGVGPGTPYFDDAPRAFHSALTTLDFGEERPESRDAALETVLAEARERDALTLWHLLTRVEGKERNRVYERLTALTSAPAGVTREGMLRLDRKMLGAWQEKLELGWFEDDPAWRKAWRKLWKKF